MVWIVKKHCLNLRSQSWFCPDAAKFDVFSTIFRVSCWQTTVLSVLYRGSTVLFFLFLFQRTTRWAWLRTRTSAGGRTTGSSTTGSTGWRSRQVDVVLLPRMSTAVVLLRETKKNDDAVRHGEAAGDGLDAAGEGEEQDGAGGGEEDTSRAKSEILPTFSVKNYTNQTNFPQMSAC